VTSNYQLSAKAGQLHGVTKSHSRPHVSNDNPHIESLFKTVKYQPEFPSSFPNIVEARAFCRAFFEWYNNEHRHSAIAYLTPADVHQGRAAERLQRRQLVLDRAFAAHPERFVRGKPSVPQLPVASYINRPPEDSKRRLEAVLTSNRLSF
jgi:putative transposase